MFWKTAYVLDFKPLLRIKEMKGGSGKIQVSFGW
jgi:hypothetical protein